MNEEDTLLEEDVQNRTLAEMYLDLAEGVAEYKEVDNVSLKEMGKTYEEFQDTLARINVAQKLRGMPKVFIFRAIFEEWGHQKLIREMYV